MCKKQPNDPLHSIKLADILEYLVDFYSWYGLDQRIKINCFHSNPSIKSNCGFFTQNPKWARDKVEQLYLDMK